MFFFAPDHSVNAMPRHCGSITMGQKLFKIITPLSMHCYNEEEMAFSYKLDYLYVSNKK